MTPPPIALLGATGRLGGHVLRTAIARRHPVTVLVRDPARLPGLPASVRVVPGDARDPAAVLDALRGAEAAISCLGLRRGQEPPDLLPRAMASLVAARPGLILAVATAGLLDAPEGGLRRDRPGYPAAFKRGSAAHLEALRVLEAGDVPWILACPPELVDGAPDQPIRWQPDVLPPGPLRIAMPALAAWLLDQAAAPTLLRRRIGLNDAVP